MKEIISIDEFNKSICDNITLICFYAEWCGMCKLLKPMLEHLEKEYKKVKFCKIDVDKNKLISKRLGIMSVPTIIVFKNNTEIKRLIRSISEEELNAFLNSI